ncbi:MAG: tetratricopeptide repeat protein [Pirellulaceae bacterium]|nr:tetratricopeptide repeat protein [Pirellulaceae bacterium]
MGHYALLWSLALSPVLFGGCHIFQIYQPATVETLSARSLARQAMTNAQQGKFDSAETYFQKAIELNPTDTQTKEQYAQMLLQQNRPRKAIKQLNQIAQEEEEAGKPYYLLSKGYYQSNQTQKAFLAIESALRQNPKSAQAWHLKGDILAQGQRWQLAKEAYQKGLILKKNDPAIELALANIYLLEKKPLRLLSALHSLNRQNLSDEQRAKLFYLKGMAYKELARNHEAVVQFHLALNQAGSPKETSLHLAETYYQMGDLTNARLVVQAQWPHVNRSPSMEALRNKLFSAEERTRLAVLPEPISVGPGQNAIYR